MGRLCKRKPARSFWLCRSNWLTAATATTAGLSLTLLFNAPALAIASTTAAAGAERIPGERLGNSASGPTQVHLAQQSATVTYPVLSTGSTGDTVSRLQATLQLLGFYRGPINGTYGEATQAAVVRFQSSAGLAADGITGPSTWRKLLPLPGDISTTVARQAPVAEPIATSEPPVASTAPTPEASSPAPSGPPILRPDVEGSAVAQLQRELQQLGYYNGVIDGVYGELTQAAVREFQADQQLEVDAIVGPSTWDALTRALG